MVRKWTKRIFIGLCVILFLLTALLFFLHTPWGRNIVRNKAETFLSKTLQTKISIGDIDYNLLHWIQLKKLAILDQKNDTLFSGGKLYVKVNIPRLLFNGVVSGSVELNDISIHIRRQAGDSSFDYDFLMKAFAGSTDEDSTTTPSKTSAPIELDIHSVLLTNVYFSMDDYRGKQYGRANIGHLQCLPGKLDPAKNFFELKELQCSQTYFNFVDSSVTQTAHSTTTNQGTDSTQKPVKLFPFFFALNTFQLNQVYFSYKKPMEKLFIESKLDQLKTGGLSFDPAKRKLHCLQFGLDNSSFNLSESTPHIATTIGKKSVELVTTAKPTWILAIDGINLKNNALSYHNEAMKPLDGFDPNHIDANAINLLAKQTLYDSNGLSSKIDAFSFIASDRFHLKSLSMEIKYINDQLQAKDLNLVYNNSEIRMKGSIHGPGQKSPGESSVCKVENIVLSYRDILELYPQAKTLLPISMSPNEKIKLKGTITGIPEDFSMDQIQLSSDQLNFSGTARIQNSNDKNGPVYNASISKMVVKKNLLPRSLLKQLEQQNISLPQTVTITGKLNGNTNKVFMDLGTNSVYGLLAIKGDAKNFIDPDRIQYDVQLQARQFETGRLVNNEKTLGKLNGDIQLKGKGTNPALIQATSHMKIGSIVLNGYRYSNIILDGKIDKGHFSATTKISDPNLLTALQLSGSIAGNYPVLSGTMSIEKAELKSLGLSPDSMIVSGLVKIHTLNADPSHFMASITTVNNVVTIQGKTVNIDTLLINVHSEKEGTKLAVEGPFLHSSFISSYPIDQLPQQLQDAFSQLSQNKIYHGEENGWFKLTATISQDSLVSVFVPGLEFKQPLRVEGALDSKGSDSSFHLDLIAPSIHYYGIDADSVGMRAFNSGTGKVFSITAASVSSGGDSIYHTSLKGTWKDSTLELTASIKDKKQKESFAFKSLASFHKDEILVNLPEDFLINYNRWKVPSKNLLKIRNNSIIAQNFTLSNNQHVISINTSSADSISPLQIKIDSVDLGALAALAALTDTSMISGKLNIDVVIQQPINSFPIFTGKAALYQLGVYGKPIGDLGIQSLTSGDSLKVDGNLTGPNEMRLSGSIRPKEKELRMDMNVNKLDLSLLQVLLQEYIPRAYGFVKADLRFAGKLDDPQVNGMIYLDTAGFAVAELNTIYRINKQKIAIDYPSINFNEFTISDSVANKLTVDGTVKVKGPSKFEMDLQTKTRDFVALNSKQQPSSSIYGKAIVNADISIKGNSDQLAINGNAFLREGSDVHYVVNNSKTYAKGSEHIRFVDIDTLPMPGAKAVVQKNSLRTPKPLQGLKYNMKVEISKDAGFSILIDPATRDELVIRGEAQLTTGIEEDGSLGITGVYRLQSGYYNMNTQFLKGKFMLAKGSTITFNGNPYDAIADITTQYEVKTSPSGLLNSSQSDQAGASEKIPFLIVFKAKGPVSKPELSFDIRQRDKLGGSSSSLQTSIDYELAKLRNDEVAMNKQVFSLLVMNQFTVYTNETNMAESDLNPDVMLRQGMSQFISDAMNSVADGLIKGVDVNVNFQNYKDQSKSSGNRTDVGVSLSKNMNDRLTVTVGKNFTTGTNQTYAKQADQYIPDITTTYRLSKDGRYYLKAYRKNEYDVVVEGYFAKTGVSFTIQMDFNKFKDLFTRAEKLQNP